MVNGGLAAVLIVFSFLFGISLGAIGGMIYSLKVFRDAASPSSEYKKVDYKKYNAT